jgi:hypothetical protein
VPVSPKDTGIEARQRSIGEKPHVATDPVSGDHWRNGLWLLKNSFSRAMLNFLKRKPPRPDAAMGGPFKPGFGPALRDGAVPWDK